MLRPELSFLFAYGLWMLAYVSFPSLSRRRVGNAPYRRFTRLAFWMLLPAPGAFVIDPATPDVSVVTGMACYLLSGLAVALLAARPRWLTAGMALACAVALATGLDLLPTSSFGPAVRTQDTVRPAPRDETNDELRF